jgi:putative transposase
LFAAARPIKIAVVDDFEMGEDLKEGEFRISLNFHIVFSTKNQEPVIIGPFKERLWALMGDIARENRIKPLAVGGTADHIHLFMSMPTTLSVAETVALFKTESVKWVRETCPAYTSFAWQEGDASFSVSPSEIPKLSRYINEQEKFHRKKTFKQEYIALLEENGIEYDPNDLWG